MHLIVTGARGFVGRELVPLLAACGHTGVATGRTPPERLPPGWRAAVREAVLSDGSQTPDVDAIVHLEVRQHVPRPTAADVASFDTVNVQGTAAWLDWAARNAVPGFVFVSSIKAVRPSSAPCYEDAALETEAPYGRSKACAERLVQDWANADPRRSAVILRPAPVYGPGNEANIAAFVRRVRAGKPCIVGDGSVRKSIVGRTNLAAAIEFTVREARVGVDIFNVSDRENLSVVELANLIAELTHAPPPRRIPEWPAQLLARLGDCLTSQLGIPFPLTTARLHALADTSVFPCDKLVAAGFRHPRTTREGLAEMLAG